MGIETIMDPDQTCCSGYLLTCSAYLPEFSLAVTARNLALAEKRNLDTFTFCNGCFGYIRELAHLLGIPKNRDAANELIGRFGYNYQATTGIYHVQELYGLLKERIAEKVVYPLKGLRVASHYGCHYLLQAGVFDDFYLPTFHEEIYRILGATPVFYKERRACCGYAVGKGFTHKENVVQPHLLNKMTSAREEGVQLITTTCPGCNVALDREQPNLSKMGRGEFQIPVIDLGQLIALSLGVPPVKLGFNANTTKLDGILEYLGIEEGART
ncbi:MAG: Cysteine-rich domain protein [Firmicutes bacterium ADurb.Bin456]|nr:MAG: Cysteine-rich domain protein [Firmicutes bacterium ADurb.Bin456]